MSLMKNGSTESDMRVWREAASRVAEELQLDPGQDRMAKVSSLLHAFQSEEVHCDIGNMIQALRDEGVAARSQGPEISRRDVVDLYLVDGAVGGAKAPPAELGIRVSRWHPGEAGRPELLSDADALSEPDAGEVRWFDVDSCGSEPSPEAVNRVADLLVRHCSGLNHMIVRDLLTPDVQPKSETYGHERAEVRAVSVPALVSREVPDFEDDFNGVDEQLVIQIVEMVVGPGWLITSWHPSRTLRGSGVVLEGPPLLREPFLDHVAHRWLHDPADSTGPDRKKEAGDLATYLARSLAATFGGSLRMLQRWVSSWEVLFYKTLGDQDRSERGEATPLKGAALEISHFLAVVGEFSRSVNAFRLAGDEMPNKSWFAGPSQRPRTDASSREDLGEQATALASTANAAAETLTRLYDAIRADMDLLMIQSQARQQESSERLQRYLGKVTGLILVPTFVAGVFGANTALPGQGRWLGFELMLVLMAVSAAASYWVIRRIIK